MKHTTQSMYWPGFWQNFQSQVRHGCLHWLERVSWHALIIVSIVLLCAPFYPLPHVVSKLRILLLADDATLSLVDWLDLVMHTAPLGLLGIKYLLFGRQQPAAPGDQP
jgi:hypothetical protein